MRDMLFDFIDAIRETWNNIPYKEDDFIALGDNIYDRYPDFRSKWMGRLGFERKPWTVKYAYHPEDKDSFYMFKKQYCWFLYWVQKCIELFDCDRRAMKIRMTHAVGELIIPGYERHPQQIDCAEMSCAIDFLWDSYKEEDPFDYYCKHNSTENASEDIGKMLFHKKWYEERLRMTPEEMEKALRLIKEQKEEDKRRAFIWKAYKERKPLTRTGDL